MQLLDGRALADIRRAALKLRISDFKAKSGKTPTLAVVVVGDDPASQIYVANKIRACERVGIDRVEIRLGATSRESDVRGAVAGLNADPRVDAILLQLPLPAGIKGLHASEWIAPEKDVDCLTSHNLGRLWTGRSHIAPCTPGGIMELLKHYKVEIAGRLAVVVGRSNLVGKPVAHLLSEANATVTLCHSYTPDLRAQLLRASIVVVAAGRPEFLGGDDFARGSVVVDVGIHRRVSPDGGSRICGDIRFEEMRAVAGAITPVPGGVGPMTVQMLLENTLKLAEARLNSGSVG